MSKIVSRSVIVPQKLPFDRGTVVLAKAVAAGTRGLWV